jgi:hypothetical protein
MKACLLICLAAIAATPAGAVQFDGINIGGISESEKLTAVSSSAHNGYVRTRLADGSFRPETFAFGNGGVLGGLNSSDPTFDGVKFEYMTRMLAGPLANQKFYAADLPEDTNQLIMVYWGTTFGGINTQDGVLQDQINYANAKLLGFDSEGPFQGMSDPAADPSHAFMGNTFRATFLNHVHGDVMSAVEVNRYYVILRAYDFQEAWKHKKQKLLWETRFSLSERRHDFEREVPAMARSASLYFGQDSYGLVMKPVPEGRVDIGDARVLDVSSAAEDGPTGDLSAVVGNWQGKSRSLPPLTIHIDQDGRCTLGKPTRDWSASARVTLNGRDVTLKVPGWGMIFEGTVRGDRITGALTQYGHKNSVTFSRDTAPVAGDTH